MKVKVAILLDGMSVQRWKFCALRKIVDDPKYCISHVIVRNTPEISFRENIIRRINEISLWRIVNFIRTIVIDDWYREQRNLEHLLNLGDVDVVKCRTKSVYDFGNALSDRGVDVLSESDIGIRFGFGVLRGEALAAPTYGVLSYHHGDISKYRGRPPGFYEFVNNEDYAGVTVQVLKDNLDAGKVAAFTKCDIDGVKSLRGVRSIQFDQGIPLLREACDNVLTGDCPRQPADYGRVYKEPNFAATLEYVKRLCERRIW